MSKRVPGSGTNLWISFLVTLTIAGCSKPEAPAVELSPPNPIGSRAIKDLLGEASSREAQASIWTEVPFKLGARLFKTVFIQLPKLDDKGKPETCHVCGVTIAAVTYTARNGEWDVHLRQPHVVQVGQNGSAPDSTDVKFQIIGTRPVLLVESSEMQQGWFGSTIQMIAFDKEWSDIGTVWTGEDNTATSSCFQSTSRAPEAESSGLHASQCGCRRRAGALCA